MPKTLIKTILFFNKPKPKPKPKVDNTTTTRLLKIQTFKRKLLSRSDSMVHKRALNISNHQIMRQLIIKT